MILRFCRRICVFTLLYIGVNACSTSKSNSEFTNGILNYAQTLSIDTTIDYSVCTFKSNAQQWIVCKDSVSCRKRFPDARLIQYPLTRIIALGSVYAGWVFETGHANALVGIDDIAYSTISALQTLHNAGRLFELKGTLQSQLERIIQLKPQLIITAADVALTGHELNLLQAQGIAVWRCTDYLESHPLGRSEWITLAACLFGNPATTLKSLKTMQWRYAHLRDSVMIFKLKPKVLSSGMSANGIWYVPGGRSFASQLISDAGGDYIWHENQQSGSLEFSTEYIAAHAKNATVWINPFDVQCLERFGNYPKLIHDIKALQTGRVYQPHKIKNTYGYSAYWDQGLLHPDQILKDLIVIFHNPTCVNQCRYYYTLPEQCP
jgi:iron complex transport system substrate-binding protein